MTKANEEKAAAHREFDEELVRKWGLLTTYKYQDDPIPNKEALAAIDEAVRTALEKAAQRAESFNDGDEAVMAFPSGIARAIRSIVLRAEDVREG